MNILKKKIPISQSIPGAQVARTSFSSWILAKAKNKSIITD